MEDQSLHQERDELLVSLGAQVYSFLSNVREFLQTEESTFGGDKKTHLFGGFPFPTYSLDGLDTWGFGFDSLFLTAVSAEPLRALVLDCFG